MKTSFPPNQLLQKRRSLLMVMVVISYSFTILQGQILHNINTAGNSFNPNNLTIQLGDTVRWTNTGSGFHNVAADDNSFRCANGCDGNGGNGNPASNQWSFTIVFNSVGSVPYYCQIHGSPGGSGMSGTITVQAAATPSCTNLTAPTNGATDISATTALTWSAASGSPTGYRLQVGTSSSGTQILNNFDVGNVTTYGSAPAGSYPNNFPIFVTIIPYNASGDATGCSEESFTTEACTPNLAINGATVPDGTYNSSGDLTSQNASVPLGSTVSFSSDTGVLLEFDFTVEMGGDFEANIQSCLPLLRMPKKEAVSQKR